MAHSELAIALLRAALIGLGIRALWADDAKIAEDQSPAASNTHHRETRRLRKAARRLTLSGAASMPIALLALIVVAPSRASVWQWTLAIPGVMFAIGIVLARVAAVIEASSEDT